MSKVSAQISKVSGGLLFLFAVSVLISQSLMDLFSTLLCLYLAFEWVRAKKRGLTAPVFPKMGFDLLWIAWFIIAALGFLLNAPPPETPPLYWATRLIEFKWVLILYFLVTALHTSSLTPRLLTWLWAASLVCSTYALIAYAFERGADPTARLGGLFDFSMTYAHVYGLFFCGFAGFCIANFKSFSLRQKFFWGLTLFVLGCSVLLTYTRGIWIGVFLSLILMSFFWRLRAGLTALVSCVLAVCVLYVAVPSVRARIDFTTKVANAEEAKTSYDTERVILWKTNWMIFKDHPWVGTGYGQNKFHLPGYYQRQGLPADQFVGHAHNQYLHLLAGTGILGLLCYLGILFSIFGLTCRAYFKIPTNDLFRKGLALGSIGGQLCFMIGGITEANFEHSKVRFAAMLLWALGLWLWQERRDGA